MDLFILLNAHLHFIMRLLKMLDNNSASSVSARYRDRWLEVKLIIITTVLTIEDFHTAYENPSEPIEQLMRRCKEMIMLTKTHKSLYIYNNNKQSYQLIGEGKNNIPAQFATENSLQKEALKKLCSDFDVSYVESYDSVQQSFIDVTDRIDTKLFTG